MLERMCDDEQIESWLPVVGYSSYYEVSDQGRVRAIPATRVRQGRPYRVKGRVLKPRGDSAGRETVMLYAGRGARGCSYFVHRLVLEAFVGPRPEGLECCHFNDNSQDNRLVNLRWDTRSANEYDKVRNGGDHNARKTHCNSGHEFTPENTILRDGKWRQCRECGRIATRAWARVQRSKPLDKALCGQCEKPRDSNQFRLCNKCREYRRAYSKVWRDRNPEEVRERNALYRARQKGQAA